MEHPDPLVQTPPDADESEAVALPPERASEPLVEPGPAPVAELVDVSKSYGGAHALGPVTLRIDGACTGLLGPNGAGKTTLIRMLMGLIGPTSGSLRVLGGEVDEGGRRIRQRIGYVPEGEALFPGLNGVAGVAYAGRLSGMPRADALQRAHQVLDYVGLGEARYRFASTYSTGMRQRLKLAQALVHDPEVLILDEPTEGVDPPSREDLLAFIKELAREHGVRILISTHILADVERLATHVVLLDRGAVVTQGPLDELRRRGSRGHVVRLNGDPTPFTTRLDAAGAAWRMDGAHVHVEMEDPAEILALVRDAGLVVRHIAPAHMKLDEAFIQAIGGAPDA